jgi:hypothetical protein
MNVLPEQPFRENSRESSGPRNKFLNFFSLFPAVVLMLSVQITIFSSSIEKEYSYPNPSIYTDGLVYCVLFHDNTLFIAGGFRSLTGTNGKFTRSDIGAINVSTGEVLPFAATTNRGGRVRTVIVADSTVYIGGSFTQVNGYPCSKVAALDIKTGNPRTQFRMNGDINGTVWALAHAENTLYIGGEFSLIDSLQISNLAAVNAQTGTVFEEYNPSPSDPFNDSGRTQGVVRDLLIHPHNPQLLFVAGNFQKTGENEDAAYLISLFPDGTLGPSFQRPPRQMILDIDIDDDGQFLYAGGGGFYNCVISYSLMEEPFERVWNGDRAEGDAQAVAVAPQGYVYFGFHDGFYEELDAYRMAVLNANTGEVHDAFPEMNHFFGVWALDVTDKYLAVGGDFTQMNGISQTYFALFEHLSYDGKQILSPSPISLTWPRNDWIISPYYVRFRWTDAIRSSSYELQVSTDSLFLDDIRIIEDIYDNSYTIDTLLPGTRYFWRVRAFGEGGASEWSEAETFITESDESVIPFFVYPENNATDIPLSFTLSWTETAVGNTCAIQLATDTNFNNNIVDRDTIASNAINVSGLEHATTYFVRIASNTISGKTDWHTATFTTAAQLSDIPRCISPGNNEVQVDVHPKFIWNMTPEATVYSLQVGDDSLFNRLLADISNIQDTVLSGGVTLAKDRTYFWRVIAYNPGGLTTSLPFRFSTVYPPPNSPYPYAPKNNSTLDSVSVTMKWQESAPHVSEYRIIAASDDHFKKLTIDTIVESLNNASLSFEETGSYWWKMQAINKCGSSEFSKEMQFTIAPLNEDPIAFMIKKLYLSRNKGYLQFQLPEENNTSVILSDLGGHEIWRKDNLKGEKGINTLLLPNGFKYGLYLLTISANNEMKSARVIFYR